MSGCFISVNTKLSLFYLLSMMNAVVDLVEKPPGSNGVFIITTAIIIVFIINIIIAIVITIIIIMINIIIIIIFIIIILTFL